MLNTPAAVELMRRWPFSFGGDDERPWTAESTLVRGTLSISAMMTDGFDGTALNLRQLRGFDG